MVRQSDSQDVIAQLQSEPQRRQAQRNGRDRHDQRQAPVGQESLRERQRLLSHISDV